MYKLFLLSLLLTSWVKLSQSFFCPHVCSCKWITANLKADCSNLGLTELPDFEDIPIEILDLSNNLFTEFPFELYRIKTLTRLDLSRNLITHMDSSSLNGFTSLNILLLNENNISNWRDIDPNSVLLPAINLHTFSLAGNPLYSFSSSNEDLLLMSTSLKVLDLSECKITKIFGQYILQGLANLERLILKGNPIRTFSHFASNSLKMLDLSNCGLTKLYSNVFADLQQLISVDLSRNPGLILTTKAGEFVRSETVMHLDLSYCNMDAIDVIGFPYLISLHLKGNMIKTLSQSTFENNKLLEDLDISNNAINEIGVGTFTFLKSLKRLDLSYNSIPRIERNAFSSNEMLTTLNLSRNFINKLSKFIVSSLARLNLSGCEIMDIDHNALAGMPNLIELDLSYNLMSHLPAEMESETLQILDLSMCRLTSIRNTTFRFFTELTSLKLSGNRFTTTFRPEFFKGNPYLHQIWLGDNPWRCDCQDNSFMQFYIYITERPPKIKDRSQLQCASPDAFYGKKWDETCFKTWFQGKNISKTEKMWSIIMVSVIIISVGLCIIVSFKRYWVNRKRRRSERDLRRNVEEQREIMRQNRMMMQQEAQLNAPDPRETLPPCYEDALLMPRLEREFKSMLELNIRRNKDKATNSKRDENSDLVLDYRRFQSEEILSVRDRERTLDISTPRRHGQIERINLSSRILAAGESKFPASYLKSQNLESAEKIANFQSYESSPYSKRRPKQTRDDQRRNDLGTSDSVEILSSFDSINRSPYSRRKPKNLLQPKTSVSQWTLSSDTEKDSITHRSSINLVEGYFSKPASARSSSSEFQIMNHNSSESLKNDPPVIVHRPNISEM